MALVSAKGHQCVTEEIVGISHTLVVGGELNQHKSGGSLSPLGLTFGVQKDFLQGVRPVGPTLPVLG